MAYRRKTRSKLRLRVRERYPVTRSVQEFKPGESVHIRIDPSFHKGMPHPRFEGRTAKVMSQRGRAFLVQVRDGQKFKTLIARPEHLSLSPGSHGQSSPGGGLRSLPGGVTPRLPVHRPAPRGVASRDSPEARTGGGSP